MKIVILMALSLCLFSSVTSADTFPTAHGRADNKYHYVCWVPGGTAPDEINKHLKYMQQTLYGQTGVWPIPYPCVPLVDAWLDDGYENPDAFGVRSCRIWPLTQPGNICIESDVKINPVAITAAAKKVSNVTRSELKRAVWCHEMGHSFGLSHHNTDGDCMKSGMKRANKYSFHHRLHLKTL